MANETKFHEIKGVEVFDVGKWNGEEWSDEQLDEMVENFGALKGSYDFPAKLGHPEMSKQQLLKAEGLPAAAWIKKLYRKGTKLVADLERVPEKVYELIKNGAYKAISAEIFPKVQLNGKTYENVLANVAILGAEIPGVGSLDTLDSWVKLYERADAHPLTFGPEVKRTIVRFDTVLEDVDDEAEKLEAELESLADRAKEATKGTRGAPAFRTFLSETLAKLRGLRKSKNSIGDDTSAEAVRTAIEKALRDQFGGYPYVVETFTDYVIVDRDGRYWQTPYAINDAGEVTLSDGAEVERTWRPKNAGNPGEEEADMATTKAVLAALGLPETADEKAQLAAIEGLKADKTKHAATTDDTEIKALREEVTKLRAESTERDAKDAVKSAIDAHKILPADQEWALAYAAKDSAGFKTYIEKTPTKFSTDEKGSAADAPGVTSDVAQFQAKVAEKLKADPKIDVPEAQRRVAAEEPELYSAIRARR